MIDRLLGGLSDRGRESSPQPIASKEMCTSDGNPQDLNLANHRNRSEPPQRNNAQLTARLQPRETLNGDPRLCLDLLSTETVRLWFSVTAFVIMFTQQKMTDTSILEWGN